MLYLLNARYSSIKSANKKIDTGQAPINIKYIDANSVLIKNIREKIISVIKVRVY